MQHLINHSQKLDNLDVMAGGITHDFNNIMMILTANASILSRKLEGQEREVAKRINDAARVASKRVNQLRQYTSNKDMPMEVLDVNEVANSVLTIIRASQPFNVTVKRSFPESELFIQADKNQLHQMMLNLLVNAFEPMGPNGGTITVETEMANLDEQHLEPYYNQHDLRLGSYVLLVVHDTGVGISPEAQRNIFDLFFTTKPNSHGLGLSAVQNIIYQHGGGIRVQSKPGEGTNFTVLLPLFNGVKPSWDA